VSQRPQNSGDRLAREGSEDSQSPAPGPAQVGNQAQRRSILQFNRGRFLLRSNGRVPVLPRRLSRRLRLPQDVEVVDPRFLSYSHRYLLQAVLATLAMLVVLLFIDSVADVALAAGLGSSVVILFLHPSASAARPRSLIGGHVLALAVGIGCSLLIFSGAAAGVIAASRILSDLSLAASLGLVILIMAITNTEHPPAAGTVLGISMQPLDPVRLAVFLGAIVLLALIQWVLRPRIQDLI
jgi:hypothetical protein